MWVEGWAPMIVLVTASIWSMNQGDTYINDGEVTA